MMVSIAREVTPSQSCVELTSATPLVPLHAYGSDVDALTTLIVVGAAEWKR